MIKIKKVIKFFDKLEDKIRGRLSHYPIFYALIGGVGVVLFWRGVWHTADFFTDLIFSFQRTSSIDLGNLPWWDGPLSLFLGSIMLLSTGLFVFGFIGNEIIISGLKGEKKLNEKTEEEVETEETQLRNLQNTLEEVDAKISDLEKEVEKK